MSKILVVEDDHIIAENLIKFLNTEGFEAESASGQSETLKKLENGNFDLILLDVALPDGNGFAICSAVKAEYGLPVIFLTASGDEYSTVTGFDVGADDYISKPFRPRELVSRIKNVLRRAGKTSGIVDIDGLRVDTVKGVVSRRGKELYLSALEYKILLVFLNNRGAVLSRGQLLREVWDFAGEFVSDNTLTVYIKRLREKIEDDPQNPTVIKTIRGLGYRVD